MQKRIDPERTKQRKKKESFDKRFSDLWPGAYYDEENLFYVKKDGSCFDLLKIESKDLNNASQDEIDSDISRLTKMLRIIVDDIKIISMNYPTNTQPMIDYFRYKASQIQNDIYSEWLKIKSSELEYLQKNSTERQFIIMINGKNPSQLMKTRETIIYTLGSSGLGTLISEIESQKKHDILFRICNKCVNS